MFFFFFSSLPQDSVCSLAAPCKNGATCVSNSTSPIGYTCQCAPGFSGPTCEVCI